jgi:hypothetical protein
VHHSYSQNGSSLGNVNVHSHTHELPFWHVPLQALALVVSLRLGLQHLWSWFHLDNNFSTQEALNCVVKNSQNLMFFTLDFEKACDKIEWDFCFFVLNKLNFSLEWVKWDSTLYWHSTSKIKINVEIKDAFSLHRLWSRATPLPFYINYWRPTVHVARPQGRSWRFDLPQRGNAYGLNFC